MSRHGFGGQRWRRHEYCPCWPNVRDGDDKDDDDGNGSGSTPPPSVPGSGASHGAETGSAVVAERRSGCRAEAGSAQRTEPRCKKVVKEVQSRFCFQTPGEDCSETFLPGKGCKKRRTGNANSRILQPLPGKKGQNNPYLAFEDRTSYSNRKIPIHTHFQTRGPTRGRASAWPIGGSAAVRKLGTARIVFRSGFERMADAGC